MPDVTDLLAGDPEEIAGYRVVGRLGAGGQGVVYLANAPSGGQVAIKQLRFGRQDDRARQQFAKEVAAARLVAPFCTAQVLDAELDGASPYVVSEYIDGPSLQQRVEQRGPLTGASLHRLAIGTATALAAIHQAGVVHRDFKPANVMLAYDGPRVIDFGIARDLSTETTVTSRVFGTPAYMAPEQLRAERVGPATDMFAWASVIACAATGRAPFEAPHMAAVMHRISSGEPDLTGVPADLVPVLRHCLIKDPAERPSAQQALALLLGRPAPERDAADPTQVLAEATGIVHAAARTATTQEPRSMATGQQAGLAPTVQQGAPGPTAQQGAPGPTVQQGAPAPTAQQGAPHSPAARPWGDGNVILPPAGSPDRPARRPWAGAWIIGAVLAIAVAAAFGAYRSGLFDRLGNDAAKPGGTSSPSGGPSGAGSNSEPSDTDPSGAEPDPEPSDPGPSDPGSEDPGPSAPDENAEDGTVPEAFSGTWEGIGRQPLGRVKSWTVRVELDEGDTVGTLELDSLDCGGELTVVSSSAAALELIAEMDDNPTGQCADRGAVRLTRLSAERLSFYWEDLSAPENRATGTLRRQ